MEDVEHHSAWGGRYSVPDHEAGGGTRIVVDARTPLSVLLEGEPQELAASREMVNQAAIRVAERVCEEVEVDFEMLVPLLRSAMEAEILEARASTARTMLRYIWEGARHPWDALKKLLATTRLFASYLLSERGVSQVMVSVILGETKGATRAREKKVEGYMKEWGVLGYHLEGGQKSESARATYARVQRGNRNRSKGKPQKRGR